MFNKPKSTEADFRLLSHEPFLDIMNKNLLYITRNLDLCVSLLKKMELDERLQKQIPDYPLEDMTKDIPEEV